MVDKIDIGLLSAVPDRLDNRQTRDRVALGSVYSASGPAVSVRRAADTVQHAVDRSPPEPFVISTFSLLPHDPHRFGLPRLKFRGTPRWGDTRQSGDT
jgi:hypothetical protein